MPKLYCSAYCERKFLGAWPNNRIGRKRDQSTGWPRGGLRIPLNGLGYCVAPSCPRKGVLKRVLNRKVLPRSEEHTSELQSHLNIVCRLLLEKKKNKTKQH